MRTILSFLFAFVHSHRFLLSGWRCLLGIIHETRPTCMCDTCFFTQSSARFIFCHHHNASCYVLPSSSQMKNRCERMELSVAARPALWLVCDSSVTTFALSVFLPVLAHPLSEDKKLHPSPTQFLWRNCFSRYFSMPSCIKAHKSMCELCGFQRSSVIIYRFLRELTVKVFSQSSCFQSDSLFQLSGAT